MGIESGSTNRWRTARERDRLKARYTIQNRLLSQVNDINKNDDVCNTSESTCTTTLSVDELNIILQYLQRIIKNDISAFSVSALARHGYLLNVSLPNVEDYKLSDDDNLSKYEEVLSSLSIMVSTIIPYSTQATKLEATNQPQPASLALSKFGIEYTTTRLIPYIEHLKQYKHRQFTIIEYASLLGRYGIVSQLLLGGIDPTMAVSTQASRKVLSLLHSLGEEKTTACNKIPLSIWSYIIRAVIEMRMNGALDKTTTDDLGEEGSDIAYCSICNTKQECHILEFGSPCHHTYCESCMWLHMVKQLADQIVNLERNIVTCPICNEEFEGFKCQQHNESKIGTSHSVLSIENDMSNSIPPSIELRRQRKQESLAKFMQLPSTSSDLVKSSKKKKKRNKDLALGTWKTALQPIIEAQQSREVRLDRFFKALISSLHLVAAYLEAGIDIDNRNVYGQTPLYLACWKGSCVVVKLLLDYGANITITANGGSSCYSIAKRHSRNDVLDLLERYHVSDISANIVQMNKAIIVNNSHNYQVSVLIDSSKDHPGAGSYIVDNALTEEELCYLDSLWESLPIVEACDDVDEQYTGVATVSKNEYRPSRRYFCDAEEEIQYMLKGCVQAARKAYNKECNSESSATANSFVVKGSPLSVFKHIRFLTYEKPGGVLPPHVDLCRVDDASGVRSTHTFILYLTDCNHGGGTALLKSLKDPQVIAVAQPKRGRAIMFPHSCPHSGLEVSVVPKVLLRGEVIL